MASSPNALAEVCGPDILGRIASFLPPNDIACTLRLVSLSVAEQFREHTVVQLSQPSPADAFAARWSAPGACRALSYKRRLQLVCLTAASGTVCNLEVALAAAGLCPTVEVMAAAAAAGQLHVCRWLAERRCPLKGSSWESRPLAAAAKGGHAEICEWLLEQGCEWDLECVVSAARGGHPELMRALLHKPPWGPPGDYYGERLLTAVAEGCSLGTLQWLWREGGGGSGHGNGSILAAAARSPTPDWAAKVAWLLEQGADRGSDATAAAAAACPDGIARLTLLVDGMGFPVGSSAIGAAADSSRLDTLDWLVARGLECQGSINISRAAVRGHTEVLRALHAAGCQLPPPEELAASACWSGSVETVSWVVETCGAEALHAAGPEAFKAALDSGSLELVTWLRERGVNLGPYPSLDASRGGCVAVLERLAEWGADLQDEEPGPLLYLAAAARGDLLTLEALRRLGVPLGRTQQDSRALVARAIKDVRAPLPALRVPLGPAHEESKELIARAIKDSHAPLPALRWLREAVGEVDWAAAAEAAQSSRAGRRAEVQAWVQAEAARAGAEEEGAEA